MWRCAAAGAAVKYGNALKGMEGHRREGGKGGGGGMTVTVCEKLKKGKSQEVRRTLFRKRL